jgi:hypothetical protein
MNDEPNGPYSVFSKMDEEVGATWWMVQGPGIDEPDQTATTDRDEAVGDALIRNDAYAAGFKACEATHKKRICKHCGGDLDLANPTGTCSHIYYPEDCEICLNENRMGTLGKGKEGKCTPTV